MACGEASTARVASLATARPVGAVKVMLLSGPTVMETSPVAEWPPDEV